MGGLDYFYFIEAQSYSIGKEFLLGLHRSEAGFKGRRETLLMGHVHSTAGPLFSGMSGTRTRSKFLNSKETVFCQRTKPARKGRRHTGRPVVREELGEEMGVCEMVIPGEPCSVCCNSPPPLAQDPQEHVHYKVLFGQLGFFTLSM